MIPNTHGKERALSNTTELVDQVVAGLTQLRMLFDDPSALTLSECAPDIARLERKNRPVQGRGVQPHRQGEGDVHPGATAATTNKNDHLVVEAQALHTSRRARRTCSYASRTNSLGCVPAKKLISARYSLPMPASFL